MKQRILTAVVLAPICLAGIILLPTQYLTIALSIIVAIAAWELASLYQLKIIITMGYTLTCLAFTLYVGSTHLAPIWTLVAASSWGFSWLLYLKPVNEKTPLRSLLSGILLFPACAVSIVLLRDTFGFEICVSLLLLVWSVDISGLVVGKRYGINSLCPAISPNKSWEGFYGQLATGSLFGVLFALFFEFPLHEAIAIAVLTTIICVSGDLFYSRVKRENGAKDSGRLLPGHGGILDRIDSLIAAGPFYWLLLSWT